MQRDRQKHMTNGICLSLFYCKASMTYEETINYLYESAPLFQQIGGKAYKEGLDTTCVLDEHFGHPHRRFRTIHVAGTNGKGSCAHTLAAILQSCGLRVGLYTSPHLVDFRERIRVNGEMMPKEAVVDFVARERHFFEPLHPSFFELTTALAFRYFAEAAVDVAVIEVGLGGRLDCTNIITPVLSVITNISLDHTQFLGNTPAMIAAEKAGIIKSGVPVVVGEVTDETRPVFRSAAAKAGAPIVFAEDSPEIIRSWQTAEGRRGYETCHFGTFFGQLAGDCQVKNTETVLHAVSLLQEMAGEPFSGKITVERIHAAFAAVCDLTGLRGRWQVLRREPQVVCDTGHNVGGWEYLGRQLSDYAAGRLHVVFGMAGDKDVDTVLSLLPASASYYFTQASVRRAMPAEELRRLAVRHGLKGGAYDDVPSAYKAALAAAAPEGMVYVGGSSFVVADLLAWWRE